MEQWSEPLPLCSLWVLPMFVWPLFCSVLLKGLQVDNGDRVNVVK